MKPFIDRLAEACRAKGAPLCVGLDPHLEQLPEALLEGLKPTPRAQAKAVEAFGEQVIAAVAPAAAALKINIAFYERLGVAGMRAYARTLRQARRAKLLVIADVKRGDIGSTARAYAEAHLGRTDFRADAVTLNPLLGEDSMTPFLERAAEGAGLFVLVRTSNPGGAEIQGGLEDPASLSRRLAEKVRAWGEKALGRCGWSSVGAVVGATRGTEIAALRAQMPRTPFLLPGIGAQGGSLQEAASAFDAEGRGGLLTASRSVLFAHRETPWAGTLPPGRWSEAVAAAARALSAEIRQALAKSLLAAAALSALTGCATARAPLPAVPDAIPAAEAPPLATPTETPPEDLLERPVSLSFQGAPLRTALTPLSRLGQVPVAWDGALSLSVLDTPVTLSVHEMPVRRACAWMGRLVDLEPVETPDLDGRGNPGICFRTPGEGDPSRGPWTLARADVGDLVTPPPLPSMTLQRRGTFDRLVGRTTIPLPKDKVLPGEPERRVKIGGGQAPNGMLEEVDRSLKEQGEEMARLGREAREALLALLSSLAYVTYDHPKPCLFLPGSERTLLIDQPCRGRPWVEEAIRGLRSRTPPNGLMGREEADALDPRWDAPVSLPEGEAGTAETLTALAQAAGMSVGWNPREMQGAVLRRVRLPGGLKPFGEALALVAREAGFVRILRESGPSAWLLGPRESSRPARIRWESAYTLGVYPIDDLNEGIGAETVQGLMRSRLAGDPWGQPGAVLKYHAATQRLLVRHSPEVHLEIHALLALLRREGSRPFEMGRTER